MRHTRGSNFSRPREHIPSLSVILSPGSMIGHTPRKNPTRLSPDGNLPHPRISMACTTCIIAQALCSREVFYHICVDYARVFREKDKFSFLFFPFCQNAGFLCRMHNSAAARAQEARGAAVPGREEAPRRRVRAGRVCPNDQTFIHPPAAQRILPPGRSPRARERANQCRKPVHR